MELSVSNDGPNSTHLIRKLGVVKIHRQLIRTITDTHDGARGNRSSRSHTRNHSKSEGRVSLAAGRMVPLRCNAVPDAIRASPSEQGVKVVFWLGGGGGATNGSEEGGKKRNDSEDLEQHVDNG